MLSYDKGIGSSLCSSLPIEITIFFIDKNVTTVHKGMCAYMGKHTYIIEDIARSHV